MLQASATGLAAAALGAAAPAPGSDQAASTLPPPVSAIVARYAVAARAEVLPEPVRHQAVRTLLNWVGAAVGGSAQPAPLRAYAALKPFSGPEQACLFGRSERIDALHAALVNGIASHVLDFDDTHLRTVIHPAGPVASALTALTQLRPVDGARFMNALAIGCEIECRIGNAVYPEHYRIGWHITGTTGVFGSAVATGRLLGLDETRMRNAIGLAASQPVGLKVQFGTDTKSFHPGRAAQNGMVAALLAEQGFTASPVAIEGPDGWGQALSKRHDWSQVTDRLGERYELLLNTYKPFACGIVAHPAIDAALRLRATAHPQPDAIRSVTVRVNPLVLNLMGKMTPQTGLEGKFSVVHCVAVALLTGGAGRAAFTDRAVRDPAVVALRGKVAVETDPAIATDQADLGIALSDGRMLHQHVAHAVGSQANPMSDAQLDAKVEGLATGILRPDRIARLIELCRQAWTLADAGEIGRAGAA